MLNVYKASLVSKKQLDGNIYILKLRFIEPPEIDFTAGQYLLLKIGDYLRHYSITTPSFEKKEFEILAQVNPGGVGALYFQNLKEHEDVYFKGPAGLFTLREDHPSPEKVFIATGTGIAPIRSIIRSNIQRKELDFSLFWGVKYLKDLYYFEELKELSTNFPNFKFKICLSREKDLSQVKEEDRSYFTLGRINEALEQHFKIQDTRYKIQDFYVCGSRTIVDSVREYLAGKEIPPENIHFEKF